MSFKFYNSDLCPHCNSNQIGVGMGPYRRIQGLSCYSCKKMIWEKPGHVLIYNEDGKNFWFEEKKETVKESYEKNER